MSGHETVSSKSVFRGKIIEVFVDRIRLPDGSGAERETVRHPGAVGIVGIHDGRVLMVKQVRHAVGRELLEIPAGKLDEAGESPEDCARRELEEETGYEAENLEKLVTYVASPGFTDEAVHVFLSTKLTRISDPPSDDEGEPISIEWIPVDDIPSAIEAGRVIDAKTIIGLLMFRLRLGEET